MSIVETEETQCDLCNQPYDGSPVYFVNERDTLTADKKGEQEKMNRFRDMKDKQFL